MSAYLLLTYAPFFGIIHVGGWSIVSPMEDAKMSKVDALRQMGCLNKQPEAVTAGLFRTGGAFFDSCDKVQVKYEMLRAVQVEGVCILEAARSFGYSRQTYYTLARAFQREGCVGLLDQAQGRRQPEKLQNQIVEFIFRERDKDPTESSGRRLAQKVLERFHVSIHPRTIYKLLKKRASQTMAPARLSRR